MSRPHAGQLRSPVRTAVVGVSTSPICGVRDHATLLSAALTSESCDCSTHWLDRSQVSPRAAYTEIHAWTRALAAELVAEQPDATLLHYSVFSYSFRGLPVFVAPTLSALRDAGAPLVTILHEFIYPWRRDGLHGTAWAVSQRLLLISVMRASAAVVTTTDFQAEWLASRSWLPKRPVAVAPVFSNLPPPAEAARPGHRGAVIGLFGYGYGEATVALVLDALGIVRERDREARLRLLGAPGRSSSAAAVWLAQASNRGLDDALSFSGTIPPAELSDALATCDVLLFVDPLGPNPRKTTLAASLASGRPVVALDGPRRWRKLSDAKAAWIVTPEPEPLAEALATLVAEERQRVLLGARGRSFARESMSAAGSARTVADLLRRVTGMTGT
jgi:glycosyltransferase involved in cell wall biosynthesis